MRKKIEDLTIKELARICESRNKQKMGCLCCPCAPICDYAPFHYSKKLLERTIDIDEKKEESL